MAELVSKSFVYATCKKSSSQTLDNLLCQIEPSGVFKSDDGGQ